MFITPEEYIQQKPEVFWMHGLDALKHCLKGDTSATAYKNPRDSKSYLDSLRVELERHKDREEMDLSEIKEGTMYEPIPTPIWDEEGEIDVESYLDGEELCFIDYPRSFQPKPAITVIMEMSIPHGMRAGDHMRKRHEQIYKIACQAEAERRPCRVVCAWGVRITEVRKMAIFLVIKDYDDPIFPGIWGAFKSNASTNDFLNVLMDYLIGTHCFANGFSQDMDIAEHVEDDCILIDPNFLSDSRK